jgi:hypothetical protein
LIAEKRVLNLEELESQQAVELPEREMLGLITVVIFNVLNHLSVDVDVRNVKVAVQVCAVVNLINEILTKDQLVCTIRP